MSVTITSVASFARGMVLIEWTATTAGPYRVFRDGKHVDTTHLKRAWVHAGENEAPYIEVIDDQANPVVIHSARLDLNWDAVAGVKHYRIERKIASVWTQIGVVRDDGATKRFRFRTPTLDNDTLHDLRVVPVAVSGNDGTALELSRYMIRHPDPPAFTHVLESDQTLTITVET